MRGTTIELLWSPHGIVCPLSVTLRVALGAFTWPGKRGSTIRRPSPPLNAGTAEPLRVSPPEAVAYPLELRGIRLLALQLLQFKVDRAQTPLTGHILPPPHHEGTPQAAGPPLATGGVLQVGEPSMDRLQHRGPPSLLSGPHGCGHRTDCPGNHAAVVCAQLEASCVSNAGVGLEVVYLRSADTAASPPSVMLFHPSMLQRPSVPTASILETVSQ